MKCPTCQFENDEQALICTQCQTPLLPENTTQPNQKKKSSLPFMIMGLVAILAVVFVGVFFAVRAVTNSDPKAILRRGFLATGKNLAEKTPADVEWPEAKGKAEQIEFSVREETEEIDAKFSTHYDPKDKKFTLALSGTITEGQDLGEIKYYLSPDLMSLSGPVLSNAMGLNVEGLYIDPTTFVDQAVDLNLLDASTAEALDLPKIIDNIFQLQSMKEKEQAGGFQKKLMERLDKDAINSLSYKLLEDDVWEIDGKSQSLKHVSVTITGENLKVIIKEIIKLYNEEYSEALKAWVDLGLLTETELTEIIPAFEDLEKELETLKFDGNVEYHFFIDGKDLIRKIEVNSDLKAEVGNASPTTDSTTSATDAAVETKSKNSLAAVDAFVMNLQVELLGSAKITDKMNVKIDMGSGSETVNLKLTRDATMIDNVMSDKISLSASEDNNTSMEQVINFNYNWVREGAEKGKFDADMSLVAQGEESSLFQLSGNLEIDKTSFALKSAKVEMPEMYITPNFDIIYKVVDSGQIEAPDKTQMKDFFEFYKELYAG